MDVVNTSMLLAVAILNVISAYLILLARRDIKLLEQNTNSLMAQLVNTTRTEAHAAGMKEEKDKTP